MNEGDAYTSSLHGLIKRVAAKSMTYRFYHWDWGESINIEGLWRAYEVTGERRFADFVERMVNSWIAYSPDPWYTDHVGPGRVVVRLFQESGDWHLLGYAKRLADFLANLPRNELGAYFHRPDLPDRSRMIWVDSMQTDLPFLCYLAATSSDERWYDTAVAHALGNIEALQDHDLGLFYHSYDNARKRTNGVFWGRGNGWAFLGLVDMLEFLPPEHPGYRKILQSLEALAESLKNWQDKETHLWRTVINRTEAYVETSASLMLAASFLHAVDVGLLSESYAAVGMSAWRALANAVGADGLVQNVSAGVLRRTIPKHTTVFLPEGTGRGGKVPI